MNRRTKRMNRVEHAFTSMPLRHHVVDEAFAEFREYGELPAEQRLADAVCRRALGGEYLKAHNGDPTTYDLEALIRVAVIRGEQKQETRPSVRECVFDEAVFAFDLIQRAARLVIQREVDMGGDVTSEQFLAYKTLPDHAGVGLHLLGYPERLAKPPYVAQAKRLF